MDIGFYISDINTENYSNLLSAINEYISSHPYDNVIVFTNQMNKIFDDKFYVLHISHAKYFSGILFIFDIKDASVAFSFPGPKKQIFIAKDIYWQKHTKIFYSFWEKIFLSKNLEIVVDNETNYNIYKVCWKTPLDIIPNFDVKGIENVIQKI